VTGLPPRAFRLSFHGPCVPLEFLASEEHEAARRAAGTVRPTAVALRALIDTGANLTGIRVGTLAALGVRPTGTRPFRIADGSRLEAPVYLGRLRFQGGVVIPTSAAEFLREDSDVSCIIGRDILAHGRLVYDGRAGVCGLTLRGVEIPLEEPPPLP